MLNLKNYDDIIKQFQFNKCDNGSTQVQIILFSKKIAKLMEHFKIFKKDLHSKRGLMDAVNKRKKMLKYIKKNDFIKYKEIINVLNIRK